MVARHSSGDVAIESKMKKVFKRLMNTISGMSDNQEGVGAQYG